ncbi:hypothetical protein [Okeania sp. SIO2C9]|uniref:hypothetical protein n=1 Tax=Okeania sp. SIO2C9 TaxID=2607791 RepID=UPI0025D34980|nr:hypothetical protein [Okeania sp. SIO2C9]
MQQGAGYDSIYNFQVDDDFFELIDLSFEELEITEETESSDNAVISVLDSGEQLAVVEGVKADELTGFHFFPFGSDEVELQTNEEEVEVDLDAEIDETVAQEDDITSDSETDESDDFITEEDDITSDSESPETDESDNSVAPEDDITSDSESQETENETVVEEDDIASDSESQETENETVVEEDDITSDSESPETDESDNSVAQEDDITSESPETENETVVEEDDIASDSESPETDESDNSVTEEAIASHEPKEEKTDTLTGEEVSTETDDELLNGGSDSPSDDTDEFLLAGDDLASIPEIEVQELTTSDNNMIEDDVTTGSRTIETAERDSQDPVLAAIDTNDMALM